MNKEKTNHPCECQRPDWNPAGKCRCEIAKAKDGWTAIIPPNEMAVKLCDDLLNKMALLDNMPTDKAARILEGVTEGLMGYTIPHPYEGVPDILRSMDAEYCAGHEVGMTWRRVAQEWAQTVTL